MTKMMMTVTRAALLLVALAIVGCATSPSGGEGAGTYTSIDAWRLSNRITPLASRGHQKALHDLFMTGYLRVNEPAGGGEDLEQMNSNFASVAASVGDAKFAHALACERPEIVSAAGAFLTLTAGAYPRTIAVLKEAPKMDFPMQRAIRNAPTPLLQEFLKADGAGS